MSVSDALVAPEVPAAAVVPARDAGADAVGGGRIAAVAAAAAVAAPQVDATTARVPAAASILACSATTKSYTVGRGGALLLAERCSLLLAGRCALLLSDRGPLLLAGRCALLLAGRCALLLSERGSLLLCDERDGVAERPRPLPFECEPFACAADRVAGLSTPHLWQSRRRKKVDVHPHSTQSQNCCGSDAAADAAAEPDPLREPAAG